MYEVKTTSQRYGAVNYGFANLEDAYAEANRLRAMGGFDSISVVEVPAEPVNVPIVPAADTEIVTPVIGTKSKTKGK